MSLASLADAARLFQNGHITLGRRMTGSMATLANGLVRLGKRATATARNILYEEIVPPTLPPSTSTKATILFDINGFLLSHRFSLKRFDLPTLRRPLSEEFLFNLIGNYELISVSDLHAAHGSRLIDEIDPYGCISYRLFVQDKHDVTPAHINRPLNKLALISTSRSEFHPGFSQNIIRIPRWNGRPDSDLFTIMHFFNNIHHLHVDDMRPTILSYAGTAFLPTFREVQRRLFRHRNLLSFASFDSRLAQANDARIRSYAIARTDMDAQRKRESAIPWEYLSILIKNILLS